MMELISLEDAYKQLDGISKQSIRDNKSIKRKQVGKKIMYSQADIDKYKEELEERKRIRINHKRIINNFIIVDRNIYATAHDLWKLTQINPTTIHLVLKRSKLKFERWNNAKFYIKTEALNLLENHKGKKDE